MLKRLLKQRRDESVYTVLKISKLNAGYGTFQALFDIDIEVNFGEAVAVIGPNGAGKTTLMRAVSGLIPIKSGSVDMEGVDLGLAYTGSGKCF